MIILCGASASGKTEVAKLLAAKYGLAKVVTNTTRAMRQGEKQDVDYHFTSREDFQKLKEQDYFVETTCYNGNFYGCAKKEIADNKCVILEPEGVSNFLKLKDPHIVVFALTASKEIRKKRMNLRGDADEAVLLRLASDDTRFSPENLSFADFTINTDDKSIEEITTLVYYLYHSKIESEK